MVSVGEAFALVLGPLAIICGLVVFIILWCSTLPLVRDCCDALRLLLRRKARDDEAGCPQDYLSFPTAAELQTLVTPSHGPNSDPQHYTTDAIRLVEPLSYRPLQNADAEIRLLTLWPQANTGSLIRCTLKHTSLLDSPEYIALSYAWGDPNETRTILVDGHEFQITTNLHYALERFQTNDSRTFWIDAICINALDREEKSHQIQRMRSIYAQAQNVYVWLGPESTNSNLAMFLLDYLSKADTLMSRQKYSELMKERSVDTPPGPFAEAWTAFDDLFSREFWQRVWIIQEITASRDVVIHCGGKSILWSDLEVAFWRDPFTCKRSDIVKRKPRRTAELFDFWGWKKAMARGEPKDLLQALMDSRRSKATDLRDHIYALLGIVSDASTLVFIPNYKLSVEQVFIDLATAMIKAEKPDIICLRSTTRSSSLELPSWVPDWSNLAATPTPWTFQIAKHACSGFQMRKPSSGIRFDNKILCVTGHYLGTIDGLTMGLTNAGSPYGRITQPQNKKSGYYCPSICTLEILTMLLSIQDTTEREDSMTARFLLCSRFRELLASHSSLDLWVRQNQDFRLEGVPLHQWMSKNGSFMSPSDLLTLGPRLIRSKRLLQEVKEFMNHAEIVLKTGMRLMTTSDGLIGMTHPQAKSGDHLFAIHGMNAPIALRLCSEEELGPDAVANQKRLEQDIGGYQGYDRMALDAVFRQGYKVIGEAPIWWYWANKFPGDYLSGNIFIH